MKWMQLSRGLMLFALSAITLSLAQEKPMKQWSEKEYEAWAKQFYVSRVSPWSFAKTAAGVDRKADGIVRGNRIEARVANFGSIGAPRKFPSVVWPKGSGRSMGYEFGPIAGAEVKDKNGSTIHIISDALIDGGERQNPRKQTGNVMGWEPLPGYSAAKPNESVANNTNPQTWPPEWNQIGWPGRFGQGVITADEESYWVMDDRFNDEFEYYPLVNGADSIRGLGLQLSCRTYQFAAGPAQDILFLLYELKLREDAQPLDRVVVGMVGDPHVGGPADFSDDYGGFDRTRNMVYAYDAPGSSNDYGVANVGYLGFMFIQPSGVGDTNWLPLTAFNAPRYGSVNGSDDERMWQMLIPNLGPADPPPLIEQNADNLFIFGSGYFSLKPGQTQRFAIAILMGNDLTNLQQNADVALRIAELDFQFARPPELPTVCAVPDDRRVTVYWNGSVSENTIDPFLNVKDFEGFRVYRSDDNGVTWGKPITDNRGNQVMWEPLAIYDKVNEWEGTHSAESAPGLHYYLGKNSGLQYVYVDSSLELRNGVKYLYAVTAFDHGDTNLLPLENALNVGAINVVSVTPNAPVLGLKRAGIDSVQHASGSGTGKLDVEVLDPFVITGETYQVKFSSTPQKYFVLLNSKGDTIISNSGQKKNTEINGERTYLFNGLMLEVDDEDRILLDPSKTKWTSGSANLGLDVVWFSGTPNYAGKYKIIFSDSVIDTSIEAFGRPAKPIRFSVRDVSRSNERVGVILRTETGKSDTIDNNDQILLLKDTAQPITTSKITWQITFKNPADTTKIPVSPRGGDVAEFSTLIPFNSTLQDTYTIYGGKTVVETSGAASSMLDDIKVVPNPYLTASRFEQKTPYRTGRGERVIKFTRLPIRCTIRIYTIAGEHVKTLEHEGDMQTGSEQAWDLMNKDGLDVAPGLYIYHVDAPGIGEKVGRFAIIK